MTVTFENIAIEFDITITTIIISILILIRAVTTAAAKWLADETIIIELS